MNLKMNMVSCVLYYILIPQALAQECYLNADLFLTKGCAINGDSTWEFKTKDAVECARSCIRAKQCQSFNFNTASALCQLYTNSGSRSKSDVNMVCSDITKWPTQVSPGNISLPSFLVIYV